jgi:hypothetical protein
MADHKHVVHEVDAQENTIANVAVCASYAAAVAAFESVVRENPKNRYMLRQGSRILKRSHSAT